MLLILNTTLILYVGHCGLEYRVCNYFTVFTASVKCRTCIIVAATKSRNYKREGASMHLDELKVKEPG